MPLNVTQTRQYIRDFDFTALFVEELGWNYHEQDLPVPVDDQTYTLNAIAEKSGMVAFDCACSIPDYATRRKIERQLAKSVHEHLIIYADKSEQTQIWQWVKREVGKPAACREHRYHCNQPGDSLIQKLQSLAFAFEEEGDITILDVTSRVRAAFDVDRVTKRFYDSFKAQHAAFLNFIKGIPDEELQRWYASVMLNRLMFIYFIQKKGFLNNDHDYLRTKLLEIQQRGRDCFYTDFLCPLFFQGFAQEENERSEETQRLLGMVPYLNGGIFLRHQIEELHGEQIHIADAAFEKLFDFFEQYHWHLDERPLREDNEINPDVLGYIFEKYINQKQMGAYYTKEDITEYISKNTVIPHLFDSAHDKCRIAFVNPKPDTTVWRLLRDDPDRYIYDAVKKGVELPLPENIAAGLDDVSKRTEWNKSAPEEYALPTEIWREVAARRKRYDEARAKLANGEICNINDLITYNLDIHQFAQDVIQYCEGPELLRAFWHSIEQIKILDPTCGSGAFLFAALNILDPLYEACIDRMQAFIDELDSSGEKHRPEKFSDFRKVLDRMSEHPNTRYFILKSIMVNNLYGVDIMEEAIEICKLRMFLKLVAQVEHVENLEPLPDIDFNVRAGNTLVGYASLDDVRKTLEGTLGFTKKEVDSIEQKAQDLEASLSFFQEMQTEQGMIPQDFAEIKLEVRQRMEALENELNHYLASDYGIDASKQAEYSSWLSSHRPFHWFIEFHGIMRDGGFGLIIGNPPYVEYSKIKHEYRVRNYETEKCGNLYPFVVERSANMLSRFGRCGMIIPVSAFSTERMTSLQSHIKANSDYLYVSSYAGDYHPAVLFDGSQLRLCIFLMKRGNEGPIYSTKYMRWYTIARGQLFSEIEYEDAMDYVIDSSIPKIGNSLQLSILGKVMHQQKSLSSYFAPLGRELLYYHNAPIFWVRAFTFAPYFWNERDGEKLSSQIRTVRFETSHVRNLIASVMNSTLYFIFWLDFSDAYHLNSRELLNFKIDVQNMQKTMVDKLSQLCIDLMNDFQEKSTIKNVEYKTTGKVKYQEIDPKKSKVIIDEIDRVLAEHYGFTNEELDFIINYDIKYRMERESLEGDE